MSEEKLYEIIDKLLLIGQYGIAYEIAYHHVLGLEYVMSYYEFKLKNIEIAITELYKINNDINNSRVLFLDQETHKIKMFLNIKK
jgi:hypothetical protein